MKKTGKNGKKADKREKKSLKEKDFLSVDDFSGKDIARVYRLAEGMKKRPGRYRSSLSYKMLALIFEKPSLRTRTTFTVGIKQLGGDSLVLTAADINLGKRESVEDVAKNLERMVDGIMIRTFGHEISVSLAEHASIPVINGLTDREHPCQALADFFTISECGKNLRKAKISYIGDGNNVAHSLMLTAAKLGATLYVATPQEYRPVADIVARAGELAARSGATVVWTNDPIEAARGADVIYTDTWASMGQETEAEVRRNILAPYQVNGELFANAKSSAIFMHCLPAHRGEEVTDEVIDSRNSVVYQQAENRLHVQKAIMYELLR
ncbi:MAG: ornithine carbamoyltransferase [Bacteroidota bacterium]